MKTTTKLFSTGAAARAAGLCPATLLTYVKSGELTPWFDSSGRRLFTDEHVALARALKAQHVAERARLTTAVLRRHRDAKNAA